MSKSRILIGSPALMRETNARTILALLKKRAHCSRADLVRETGMSAPTVANVVSDLSDRGLIEWIGEGVSGGGRRPENLRFNAAYGFLAGTWPFGVVEAIWTAIALQRYVAGGEEVERS